MAGAKKSKGGAKAKGAKSKPSARPAADEQADGQAAPAPRPSVPQPALAQLSVQERVERVKTVWRNVPPEKRVDTLQVPLEDILAAAREADQAPLPDGMPEEDVQPVVTYEEILEGGVERKRQTGTWKEWTWPAADAAFTSQDDFRAYLLAHVYPPALHPFLGKEREVGSELPAELQLRARCAELWREVNDSVRAFQEQLQEGTLKVVPGAGGKGGHKRTRASVDEVVAATKQHHIDMIIKMMASLCQEHDLLYTSIAHPLTLFLVGTIRDSVRASQVQGDLYYEDLQKLSSDDVAAVFDWVLEKVDGLAASWKDNPEAKPEESAQLADVDLFSLSDSDNALRVHPVWLSHLQERVMGPDGIPHKSTLEEDPGQVGLVLEWVYGSIVSTSEKARENAKRHLWPHTPPDATTSWQLLQAALKEQQKLDESATSSKVLLRDMLVSRQKAQEYTKRFELDKKPPGAKQLPVSVTGDADLACSYSEEEFPSWVILELSEREKLLTTAKLQVLRHNLEQGLRDVRQCRYRQRQGEPVFERLKKQLEDVKNAHRGLDGSYRSTAEMDRQRQVMADLAIEEQLQAQTAFRTQGALLQSVVNKLHAQEMENRKIDQEIKQLMSWKQTISSVIMRLKDLIQGQEGHEHGQNGMSHDSERMNQEKRAVRLRNQFFDEMRKQLYTEDEDRTFYADIQAALVLQEARLEQGEVVIVHLEQHLLNVACDDPGSTVGMALVLPLLQDQLDALAAEHAREMAARAEEDLIRLNEEQDEKLKVNQERKKLAKAKAKERQKSGKDKERAEREAKERADAESAESLAQTAAVEEEKDRLKKAALLTELRQQEEAMLEQRRQELMSEEGGFWRQRMEQEQKEQEIFVLALDDALDATARPGGKLAPGAQPPHAAADGKRRRSDGTEVRSKDRAVLAGRGSRREPAHGSREASRPGTRPEERRAAAPTKEGARDEPRRPPLGPREPLASSANQLNASAPVHAKTKPAPPAAAPAPPTSRAPAARPPSEAVRGQAPAPVAGAAPAVPAAQRPAAPAVPASTSMTGEELARSIHGGAVRTPSAPGQAPPAQQGSMPAGSVPPRGAPAHAAAAPGQAGPRPQQQPAGGAAPAARTGAPQPAALQHPGAPTEPLGPRQMAPHANGVLGQPAHPREQRSTQPPQGGVRPTHTSGPAPVRPTSGPVYMQGMQQQQQQQPGMPPGSVPGGHQQQPYPVMQQQQQQMPPGMMPPGSFRPFMPPHVLAHAGMPPAPSGPRPTHLAQPHPNGVAHPQHYGHPAQLQQQQQQPQPHQPPGAHAGAHAPQPGPNPQPGAPADATAPRSQATPRAEHRAAELRASQATLGPLPGQAAAAPGAATPRSGPPSGAMLDPQATAQHAGPTGGPQLAGPPSADMSVRMPSAGAPASNASARLSNSSTPTPCHQDVGTSGGPPGMPGGPMGGPSAQGGMGSGYYGGPAHMQQQQQQQQMYMQGQGGRGGMHSSGVPLMGGVQGHMGVHMQMVYSRGGGAQGHPGQFDQHGGQQQQHLHAPHHHDMQQHSRMMQQGLAMVQQGMGALAMNGAAKPRRGLSAGAPAFIPLASRVSEPAPALSPVAHPQQPAAAAVPVGAPAPVPAAPAERDQGAACAAPAAQRPQAAPDGGADVPPAAATQPPPPGMAQPAAQASAPALASAARAPAAAPGSAPRPSAPPPPSPSAGEAAPQASPSARTAAAPANGLAAPAPPNDAPPAAPQAQPAGAPTPPSGSSRSGAGRGTAGGAAAPAHARTPSGSGMTLAMLTHEHAERLRLVSRIGLTNDAGQHNCFLNVIVQALWHLPAFVRGLTTIDPSDLRGADACPQEVHLLTALRNLFRSFQAAHASAAAPAGDGAAAAGALLSPAELRHALPDKLFKRLEMHDASEVLHEIFRALHVAEAGPSSSDPTLPDRILVDAPAKQPKAGTWAAKAATPLLKSNGAAAGPPAAPSLVSRVFGIQVQVPVASGSVLAGQVPGQHLLEVERYTKYFQNVTTHCLVREWAACQSDRSPWSSALRQASLEAAEAPQQRAQLLSRPAVLALMLVWDAAHASMESVRSVVDTMQAGRQLDLSVMYSGITSPCMYRLRCVICYRRHHYTALVHSDEEGWLLFDDTHIEKPGDWGTILKMMKKTGLQPSILFYEAAGPSPSTPASVS